MGLGALAVLGGQQPGASENTKPAQLCPWYAKFHGGVVPQTLMEKQSPDGVHRVVRWPRTGRVDWDMLFLKRHHTAQCKCS